MARRHAKPEYFTCETCGKKAVRLRRDVLDRNYNALGKTPFWNCDECYQAKHDARLRKQAEAGGPSSS